MAVADKMVEYGLLQVGFIHLNIDDCWSVGREPNGTLIPDPVAFPDGIKPLADYVHSKVISSSVSQCSSSLFFIFFAILDLFSGTEVWNVHGPWNKHVCWPPWV